MPITVTPLPDGKLFISCTNGDTLVYDPLFAAGIPVRTSVRGTFNQNPRPGKITGGIGGFSAYITITPNGKIKLEKAAMPPPGFLDAVEVGDVTDIEPYLDDLKTGGSSIAAFRWTGAGNLRLDELAQSVCGKGFTDVEIELPLDLLKDIDL